MLKQPLYKWMLPKLIAKACPYSIPRSGEEGEKVNCYVVALDRDGSPYFIATGYSDQILTGLVWDGNSYSKNSSLELQDLDTGKLRVVHYYGLAEISYDSIYSVVWQHISRLIYLKIRIYRRISSTHQYFFNKRKLVSKKRIELLQFMMDDQLDRTHDGICIISLMTKLYSIKWVLHPYREEQQKKLELYLESLAESGELRKVNSEYIVTGKTISTIEKYEEEDRRHRQAVKLQKAMVFLTIILAIMAAVQSGVIKLPTLIDLSKKKTVDGAQTYQNLQIQKSK